MRYSVSLTMLIGMFALMVAPEVVGYLNGAPDLAALETVHARILQTRLVEPHLLVELPDGTQRSMEWPVPISGGTSGFRSYVWRDGERERLPGCLATIRGVPLRWTINDRFRVFELECPEKAFRIGFKEAKLSLEFLIRDRLEGAALIFPIMFAFIFLVFLREKRGIL